jgi:hypothetical protein
MIRKSTWPLIAVMAAVMIAWAAPCIAAAAQTGVAGRPELTFEVASIKPAPPSTPMRRCTGMRPLG